MDVHRISACPPKHHSKRAGPSGSSVKSPFRSMLSLELGSRLDQESCNPPYSADAGLSICKPWPAWNEQGLGRRLLGFDTFWRCDPMKGQADESRFVQCIMQAAHLRL